MQQALQENAPDSKVENWLLPKVEKILGEKGIYNGKDPYTAKGNRRSFAQLHNPYTLENLVAAMNQEEARGKGAWGLSANTLMSTATAEYKNLDEVRADKNRLQQMPEEEYKALLEKADGQIEKVVDKLRSGKYWVTFCCELHREARQPQRLARPLQKKATSLVRTQPR